MFLFHAVHRICTPCVNKFLDVEGFSYSGKKKILCKNPFYKYLLSMGRTRKRILIIVQRGNEKSYIFSKEK